VLDGLACAGLSAPPAPRVLVVAGREDHADPPMTARRIAELGAAVVVTTEDLLLGRGIEPRTLHLLAARLARAGVVVHTTTRVTAVRHGDATVSDLFSGEERVIPDIGALVLAHGRGADDDLAAAVRALGIPATLVGDALAPRRLLHAVLDGARLGANL
jgi:2,4-dienoyl-CoA reductase (NADPH2)